MKKSGIALVLSALVVTGCTSTPSKKKRSSEVEPSSQTSVDPTSVSPTSVSPSSAQPTSSTPTPSSSSTPAGSSSSSQPGPAIIDLGTMKISEIKAYMTEHPVENDPGKIGGVADNIKVTFKCRALQTFDLFKETASYGLDVSSRYKTLVGDETGYIVVAGKDLYDKVSDDYALVDTSRYTITGNLSTYMGKMEIYLNSATLNQTLDVDINIPSYTLKAISLSEFYELCVDNDYNCRGHGYGEIYTFNNIVVTSIETINAHKKKYTLNDGKMFFGALAQNLSMLSVGYTYNLIGMIDLQSWKPGIRILSATQVSTTHDTVDWNGVANEVTVAQLKQVKGYYDDTNTRYPDFIRSWAGVYKTTGYLTNVVENGKYYLGISDEYNSSSDYWSGKINTMANKNLALIENEDFWNTTLDQQAQYNPYADYIDQNTTVTIYYVGAQQTWTTVSGAHKNCWQILIIPETLPMIY